MAPSGRNKTTQNNDSDPSEQNGTQTQDTNQNVQETGVRKLVSLRRHHEMEINTLIDMLENNIYEEEDDLELINETFTELSQFQQKLDTLNDQMLQAGSEHDFEEHSHWTVQLKQKIRVFSMKVKKYLKKQVSNPATSTIPNNSAQENATSIFSQETATSMPTANIMDIPNNNLITMSNNTQGNARTAAADDNLSAPFQGDQSFSNPFASDVPNHSSQQASAANPPNNNNRALATNSSDTSTTFSRSVPKLKPTIFNGNPNYWLHWYGVFVSSIHNSNMSPTEKMIHLQSLVTGPAKLMIAGYGANGDTYELALQRLRENFGNTNRIVNSFLQRLANFKPPNLAQPESYMQFSAFLLTLVDTFEQLGFVHDICSTTNLNTALAKLPDPVRLEWNRFVIDKDYDQPSLRHLAQWFQRYAQACRDMPPTGFRNQNNNNFNNSSGNAKHPSGSRFNGFTTNGVGNQNQRFNHQGDQQNSRAQNNVNSNACPSGDTCGPLYKCEHFKALDPKQRKEHARKMHLCFNCLGNHRFTDCNSKSLCRTDNCGKKHHTLLHDPSDTYGKNPSKAAVNRAIACQRSGQSAFVPIELSNGDKTLCTYAFLDSGSCVTLLLDSVATQLGLDVNKKHSLPISGYHETKSVQVTSVDVQIRPYKSTSTPMTLDDVLTVDENNLAPVDIFQLNAMCNNFPHLKHVKYPDLNDNSISLVIGNNNPEYHEIKNTVYGPKNVPWAIETLLGWTCTGRNKTQYNSVPSVPVNFTQVHSHNNLDEKLYQRVLNWMKIENTGIASLKRSHSKSDKRAIDILENSCTLVDGHYQIDLLWKEDTDLPNNRWLAEKQLNSLEFRLKSKPDLREKYRATVITDLEKGFVTKIDAKHDTAIKSWYLPHHPVTNVNKPDKVRRVSNASSIFQGKSLNSSLLKGPDLLCNLTGLIIRFRQNKIAISADIDAMFMQVLVSPKDRPFLRYLWKENGKLETHEYTRHIFGATDSPCVACYAVRRCASDSKNDFPLASEIIQRNIYMDDLYVTSSTVEEALQQMTQLRGSLSRGGFNLNEWNSNSKPFLDSIDPNILVSPNDPTPKHQRVLGVHWNTNTDCYFIDNKKFVKILRIGIATQRKLLKYTASLFDPLGIVAPLTIRIRKVLQSVWSQGVKWDTPLDTDKLPDFKLWVDEMENFETVSFQRNFFDKENPASIQLHTFCDASEFALAAVCYLRIVYSDGSTSLKFIIGKTRVAPMKRVTIPNLELQAAVYAAQLSLFVSEEIDLKVEKTYFWSDSTTVLYWLRTPEIRHKIFVANRLQKILDVSKPEQWFHVPTLLNPADDGTRGYIALEMTSSCRWLLGPEFLLNDSSQWPSQENIRLENIPVFVTSLEAKFEPIFDIKRFSNWKRLIRTVAYCFLFAENLKRKINKQSKVDLQLLHLTKSHFLIIKTAQRTDFVSEISDIKKEKPIEGKSRLRTLAPFVDNFGILRSRGRLTRAPIMLSARYPIILAGENPNVRLLLANIHVLHSHCGKEQAMAIAQENYWILRCHVMLKSIIHSCIPCRRMQQQVDYPQMSDLPIDRLPSKNHFPFATTGLDYVGPFPIILQGKQYQAYILLFTCLVIRAVHLEISLGLSTDSTLLCIRRFFARRGKPSKMVSDCGTSFVGSNSELKKCLDNLEKNKEFVESINQLDVSLEWKFNPPAAPHFGGSWERLVQIFKLSLYKVIGSRTLSYETLATFTTEIESTMNSRPLTNVSDDIKDDLPLTPNHFLLGRGTPNLPPGIFKDKDLSLSKSWKASQLLADHFWNRFLREYLPGQQKRSKWTSATSNLQPDDMVWMLEDFTPRGLWPLAKVVETFPGQDGIVSSVKLKTPTGFKVRPVVKLSRVFPVSQ